VPLCCPCRTPCHCTTPSAVFLGHADHIPAARPREEWPPTVVFRRRPRKRSECQRKEARRTRISQKEKKKRKKKVQKQKKRNSMKGHTVHRRGRGLFPDGNAERYLEMLFGRQGPRFCTAPNSSSIRPVEYANAPDAGERFRSLRSDSGVVEVCRRTFDPPQLPWCRPDGGAVVVIATWTNPRGGTPVVKPEIVPQEVELHLGVPSALSKA